MNKFLFFLFCLVCFNFNADGSSHKLKVNIFCESRSGLARDRFILKEALESHGCYVRSYESGNEATPEEVDINIFIEKIHTNCLSSASRNWFIPNPEWYIQDVQLLKSVDLFLCRTRESERIFKDLKKKTFFLGFTSIDQLDESIEKDYQSCAHLAGASWQKGTLPLLEAWWRHPEFPHLTIARFEHRRRVPANVSWINQWLPENDFKILQNKCGIHLCLSESEGYGHYIMEAMSVGAVVIATDAPPMNEFITDERCLVPFSAWRLQHLGTNYFVNADDVEDKLKQVLSLPCEELEEIGRKNRKFYLEKRKEFKQNIKNLLEKYSN